jgi:hypothetical protein
VRSLRNIYLFKIGTIHAYVIESSRVDYYAYISLNECKAQHTSASMQLASLLTAISDELCTDLRSLTGVITFRLKL